MGTVTAFNWNLGSGQNPNFKNPRKRIFASEGQRRGRHINPNRRIGIPRKQSNQGRTRSERQDEILSRETEREGKRVLEREGIGWKNVGEFDGGRSNEQRL